MACLVAGLESCPPKSLAVVPGDDRSVDQLPGRKIKITKVNFQANPIDRSPMISPFFKLAAVSSRQSAFRYLVGIHLVCLTAGASVALNIQQEATPLLGHVVMIAGIIEGAMLLGWRLTQLPKSQSLEFLLVSPLRPRRLFLAEALVGLCRLAFVSLSGLPLFLLLMMDGFLLPSDVPALLIMPWTWGAVSGLTLVLWAYENRF